MAVTSVSDIVKVEILPPDAPTGSGAYINHRSDKIGHYIRATVFRSDGDEKPFEDYHVPGLIEAAEVKPFLRMSNEKFNGWYTQRAIALVHELVSWRSATDVSHIANRRRYHNNSEDIIMELEQSLTDLEVIKALREFLDSREMYQPQPQAASHARQT